MSKIDFLSIYSSRDNKTLKMKLCFYKKIFKTLKKY
jgi:hypothetical protein